MKKSPVGDQSDRAGDDKSQRKELLEVFYGSDLFRQTINIELWNISKRKNIYNRFTQKMLNGNTYNDCPDEDIIVWRKLSTEDKERLSNLDKKLEVTFYNSTVDAMMVYPKMLKISEILGRNIITKKEWNSLDL